VLGGIQGTYPVPPSDQCFERLSPTMRRVWPCQASWRARQDVGRGLSLQANTISAGLDLAKDRNPSSRVGDPGGIEARVCCDWVAEQPAVCSSADGVAGVRRCGSPKFTDAGRGSGQAPRRGTVALRPTSPRVETERHRSQSRLGRFHRDRRCGPCATMSEIYAEAQPDGMEGGVHINMRIGPATKALATAARERDIFGYLSEVGVAIFEPSL